LRFGPHIKLRQNTSKIKIYLIKLADFRTDWQIGGSTFLRNFDTRLPLYSKVLQSITSKYISLPHCKPEILYTILYRLWLM